jgi:hypothetical protein
VNRFTLTLGNYLSVRSIEIHIINDRLSDFSEQHCDEKSCDLDVNLVLTRSICLIPDLTVQAFDIDTNDMLTPTSIKIDGEKIYTNFVPLKPITVTVTVQGNGATHNG